ncbi:MAG: GTPase HflX [Candidatus Bathyarchaeia archaeon]
MVQRRQQYEPNGLDELESLAESAGYTIVGRLEQIRQADARYQIGSGKVEELAELVKQKDAEKVIFDNLLRPLQSYNLAKATGVEIIDRFQLILEIFTKRATTAEAQMQIKLASLRYDLTQAKERVRLATKGEQPGFMGLGAYEVDVYYESVKREVHAIRRKLKKIRAKRVLHRQRREELGFTSISLAGYTKAGKSSLFNALAEETVPVDAALFTTLSTTTRLVTFSKKEFLLTDTVGFIDRLPLTLIEAFHSTLEETIYSDLILLLVDAGESMTAIEKKLGTCLETIDRIGASGVPMITVLNKIDLMPETEVQQKIKKLEERATTLVPISALYKTNLEQLKQEILKILKNYVRATFTIPVTDKTMRFMAWLFENADVQKADYNESSVRVVFEAAPTFAEKVRSRVKTEFNRKVEKI